MILREGERNGLGRTRDVLVLHASDNVAVALKDLARGETVTVNLEGKCKEIAVKEDIPFGHKMALVPLFPGDLVIKKDTPIGEVIKPIEPGGWVHIHNVVSRRASFKAKSSRQ
ncbi:hypothetical protein E306M_23480 [Moorella sp. E306M]|nr:hypothetical protein E306M_23480 [Moorella sp. E306M]